MKIVKKIDSLPLIGKQLNRWKVLSQSDRKGGSQYVLCKCECGTEREVTVSSLLDSSSKSCGCLRNDSVRLRRSLPDGVAGFNRLYKRYKAGAESRHLSFVLSEDVFKSLVESPCHYCGESETLVSFGNRDKSPYLHNGIDRVDNTQGYTLENSVPCCSICNGMKSVLGYEQFVFKVSQIHNNLKGK
jgi:hypothetical protein